MRGNKQGRSQEFAIYGGQKRGSGMEIPQLGPRADGLGVGSLGAKPPEAGHMLISSYDGGHAPMSPGQVTAWQNYID